MFSCSRILRLVTKAFGQDIWVKIIDISRDLLLYLMKIWENSLAVHNCSCFVLCLFVCLFNFFFVVVVVCRFRLLDCLDIS